MYTIVTNADRDYTLEYAHHGSFVLQFRYLHLHAV